MKRGVADAPFSSANFVSDGALTEVSIQLGHMSKAQNWLTTEASSNQQ